MPHIHKLYDFTVSAIILHPTKPKVCLLKHRKYGIWIQPGGHVELHEDPYMALLHEIEEETGLAKEDYEIIELQETPQTPDRLPHPIQINSHLVNETHRHIDMLYLLKSKTTELKPHERESQEIKWCSLEDTQKLASKEHVFENTLKSIEWVLEQQRTRNL